MPDEEKTTLLTKVKIKSDAKGDFAAWQSKLHSGIVTFPGFVDLEIFSPSLPLQPEWVIVQRFNTNKNLGVWRDSEQHSEMIRAFAKLTESGKLQAVVEEEISDGDQSEEGVTEVFVTQVSSDKVEAFREWMGKIHEVEAKMPGFRRVYVKAPRAGRGGSWITLLQFDTQKNLDKWLDSKERQEVLSSSKEFIESLESHRVTSSFGGWFSSVADKDGIPPVWKQTMLVLLVLFPIVLLEMKYLNSHTSSLGLVISTFIGNALSVSLVSWPMMPVVIYFLYWWLYPKSEHRMAATVLGTLIVAVLYLIEIFVFSYMF